MLNLYELAKIIKKPIKVKVKQSGFVVSFINCEIKDYKSSSVIGSCWGSGITIDLAADDYFRQINGKWLVFDSLHLSTRTEFSAEIAQKVKPQENEEESKELL